jgi:hypothetical protein
VTATFQLPGLTDLDRMTLQEHFQAAGIGNDVTFDEKSVKRGRAGALEPITAVVLISGMTLTTIAVWLCRTKSENTTVKIIENGREHHVTIRRREGCDSEVIKQLAKIFPHVRL